MGRVPRTAIAWILVLLAAGCMPVASDPPPAADPSPEVPTRFVTVVITTTPFVPTPTPTPFVTPPPNGQTAFIPILMYHRLADLDASAGDLTRTWTVSPGNLNRQLEWLANQGYHTVTFPQLVAYLKRSQPLPSRPVLLTFDDGWAEGYTIAFKALVQRNFVGTFFLNTNAIGRNQYLSWAQLQEMTAAGMEVGAHTVTHPHLRTLAPDLAYKEIADSKAVIEKRLNKPVTTFDYPFGEYDNQIIDMVKRAGFESAVTIAPGYKQRSEDVYTLRRIRVSYETTLDELAKLLP